MSKPNVSFPRKNVDLFGARIMMQRGKSTFLPAVVKACDPCDSAPMVIVFDDRRSLAYREDLFKLPGRWYRIPWEDDMVVGSTAPLRPICPQCGIALGEGAAAWTRCHGCYASEPGVMSCDMGARVRGDDPYRKTTLNYNEFHEEEEDC